MAHPEFTFKPMLFGITLKTNMHVGTGGESYGIIDQAIQRDQATGFPCIYSSSLKGALKEFFKNYNNNDPNMIEYIFGQEAMEDDDDENKKENKGKSKTATPGHYRFMQAELAAIPRPDENSAYKLKTCEALKDHFSGSTQFFGINSAKFPNTLVFGNADVVTDAQFIEMVSDYQLPVVARNSLENGQSANLWYEQLLPRESKMYFVILYPDYTLETNNDKKEKYMGFHKVFVQALNTHPVQIGANASVGYGFCKLKHIELDGETKTDETKTTVNP